MDDFLLRRFAWLFGGNLFFAATRAPKGSFLF